MAASSSPGITLEVEGLRHRGGAGGLAQLCQAEQLVGRGEQGEVVEQRARLGARLGARADDQHRDVAADVAGVGRAALAPDLLTLLALLPGQEDRGGAVLV